MGKKMARLRETCTRDQKLWYAVERETNNSTRRSHQSPKGQDVSGQTRGSLLPMRQISSRPRGGRRAASQKVVALVVMFVWLSCVSLLLV